VEIIEDKKYLSKEDDIIPYFKDIGSEHLECGQGYYEDEAYLYTKVQDKYYLVEIHAEIGSAKQDIGDRLYWVESINDVKYKEISLDYIKEERKRVIKIEMDNLRQRLESLKEDLAKLS